MFYIIRFVLILMISFIIVSLCDLQKIICAVAGKISLYLVVIYMLYSIVCKRQHIIGH